jgi:hypothetical protein
MEDLWPAMSEQGCAPQSTTRESNGGGEGS